MVIFVVFNSMLLRIINWFTRKNLISSKVFKLCTVWMNDKFRYHSHVSISRIGHYKQNIWASSNQYGNPFRVKLFPNGFRKSSKFVIILNPSISNSLTPMRVLGITLRKS